MVTLVLVLGLVPFTAITIYLVIEIIAGLLPANHVRRPAPTVSNAAILIPAHNEASTIETVVTSLIGMADWGTRIVVIADNCSDSTAELARRHGAEVFERFELSRRGKGFALDFGRRQLSQTPPETVVILDADCRISADSVEQLIAACIASGRPCQAINLISPAPDASAVVQVSSFAFWLKNFIRQRGLQRLAGRVHLNGNGMGIPWQIFASAPLATSSIVEDLQLGLDLAAQGAEPLLVEAAYVWSATATKEAIVSQRKRWEGGFLAVMKAAAIGAVAQALKRADLRAFLTALDLCVPPLTLLFFVNLAVLAAAISWAWIANAHPWPLLVFVAANALALLAVLAAWIQGGRAYLTPRSLGRAPGYLFWKLLLYAGLAREGVPKEWERTNRDQ